MRLGHTVTIAAARYVTCRSIRRGFGRSCPRSRNGRWGVGPHPDGRALLHDPNLRRPTQAARVAWQPSHEPVPDGLHVLHLCDHPWCVRPTHLVLSSQATNMPDRLRGAGAGPSIGDDRRWPAVGALLTRSPLARRRTHAWGNASTGCNAATNDGTA